MLNIRFENTTAVTTLQLTVHALLGGLYWQAAAVLVVGLLISYFTHPSA